MKSSKFANGLFRHRDPVSFDTMFATEYRQSIVYFGVITTLEKLSSQSRLLFFIYGPSGFFFFLLSCPMNLNFLITHLLLRWNPKLSRSSFLFHVSPLCVFVVSNDRYAAIDNCRNVIYK